MVCIYMGLQLSKKKAKIDPQEREAQPVEEVKEESSQNCSDSEDSSGSQSSSTVEAEDIESDLESLEEHYYSDLRQYSATLERDFPAHYTTQQLNTQEWVLMVTEKAFKGFSRFLLLGPLQDLCSLLRT